MSKETRLPFTSSYHMDSDFVIFTDDWEPEGMIGFEADDPLSLVRGWFTPDQARAIAAELIRRADAMEHNHE